MANISPMEISIKKPCHETWEGMTPNEQGAFCHACMKTVIDFSSKSIEEINAFFAGRSQAKICGRFEEQQLQALSFDSFFEAFKKFELTKRLAIILFFTFGMWLFSASNASAQSNHRITGDVMVVEKPTVEGKVQVAQPVQKDSSCTKPVNGSGKKVGKVALTPQNQPEPPAKMGEVTAPPPKKKPVPKR